MRVLLLISTTTYRAEAFLEAAATLGLEVVKGIDTGPAPGVRRMTELGLDFRSPDRAVRDIVAFSHRHPVRAVVGMDDSGTLLAARASEALGLPHNPVEAVFAARDKHRMRQLFSAAGVPSPEFRLFDADDDPDEVVRQVPYPCVLKPTSLSGSRGVIRADDPESFVGAWQRLRRILRDAERETEPGSARQVLVEGFIPGREVALEGMLTGGALNVLALFDKPDPLDGPFFEETIYVTPSRLSMPAQGCLRHAAAAAAAALGLREGPVHAELRVSEADGDGDEPEVGIVEVASRSIGGLCSRVLRFGTGMSLEELILRHAVGMEIPTLRREDAAVGVMMIPIPGAGLLTAIEGVSDAESVPEVTEVRITARVGHPLVPLPEGGSYLGFIFARGETPAAVEETLRRAHGRLRFVLEAPIRMTG